jgi:hypothetical protein
MLSTLFIWFIVELLVAGAVLVVLPQVIDKAPFKKFVRLDFVMTALVFISVVILAATFVLALIDTINI